MYNSRTEWAKHLTTWHEAEMLEMTQGESPCPLCQAKLDYAQSDESYASHLACHMEDMAFHAISDAELGGDESLAKGPGDFGSRSVIQPSNDKFMAAFEDESDSSGRDGQSISGWSSDGSAHSPHSEGSPRRPARRSSRSSMKIRRKARSRPSAQLRRRASSSDLRSYFGFPLRSP